MSFHHRAPFRGRTIRPGSLIKLALLLFTASLLADPRAAVAASTSPQEIRSTFISIDSNGGAYVNQTIVVWQNASSISVPLLTPQVGEILAINQADQPVAYQVDGANITLYSLGDSSISLSYDSNALTAKQGPVWTVSFNVVNATLTLPYDSTILSISAVPVSVETVGGSPVLTLGAGSWQVSYGLPISGGVSTSSSGTESSGSSTSSAGSTRTSGTSSGGSQTSLSSSSSSATSSSSQPPSPALEAVAAVATVAILGGAAGVLLLRRRGGPRDPLRPEDIATLKFIRDKGGKVVEAEVRERFTVPRTSAWRQVKRLEQLGYVRITKLGSQNQIELLKRDFD